MLNWYINTYFEKQQKKIYWRQIMFGNDAFEILEWEKYEFI